MGAGALPREVRREPRQVQAQDQPVSGECGALQSGAPGLCVERAPAACGGALGKARESTVYCLVEAPADQANLGQGGRGEAAVEVVFATNDFLGSGWLWKEGGRWRNWKRRWFELTTISFTYYDEPEGKVLGDIPVRSGTVIEWEHEIVKKTMRYSFQITTPGRVYYIYTTDKAEFDKWEAAFQTMGCAVQRFEKVARRERSGSLSRVKLGVPPRIAGLLAPESSGTLSNKFSKSSSDVSAEGKEGRGRAATLSGGTQTLFRAKSAQRLKRLASTPVARPDGVHGQSQFGSFAEFHRFLCPAVWRTGEATRATPTGGAGAAAANLGSGEGLRKSPLGNHSYDAITTM
eukprot:m.270542 g.270542  ORF g.270542 m.270542 type:complete len:347 (-) comp16082_c0_seq1:33-1073(-)